MKSLFGWIGIGVGLAIAGASIGAVKLRNERPIVVINGEKITRSQFIAAMERANGGTVMRQMIQEKLVLQAAQKKGLMPTPAQVQAEIAQLREKDPDLDRQLRLRGKTVEDLIHDVRGRLATANLMAADVKLPEDEVKKLWAAHQKEFSHPEGRKVALIAAKTQEAADKARRLLSDGTPAEFAAQNPGMALPGGRSQIILYRGQMPAGLEKQVFNLRPGEVSPVMPVRNVFTVVKVLETIPAGHKSFDEMKDRLLLAARLQKGKNGQDLMQTLQKEAKIDVRSDRYKGLVEAALAAGNAQAARVARAK